jgi:hypothetical protein
MSANQTDNPRQSGRVIARSVIRFVVVIALYLGGFVVASHFGPALRPPISTVLEFVYVPLLKCDQTDIEPFNSVIEWLRHGSRQRPSGSGRTMTKPSGPAQPSR